MNLKLKRISMGIFASLIITTPVIAISCGKKSELEKIHDKKELLLKKFSNTIKQNRTTCITFTSITLTKQHKTKQHNAT